MEQSLDPAYVLHSRQFRDTSLIIELFCQQHGRVAVIAKGARKSSKWKGILQPFTPLLVTWRGKSDLPILTVAEAEGTARFLTGNALLSGFYINELLIRLLEKQDPHPDLFELYQQTLQQLQQADLQHSLRCFEKGLLQCIGYGLILDRELDTNHEIEAQCYYQYHLEHGARKITSQQAVANQSSVYSGKSLLALHHERFNEPEVLRDAKRLMRQMIAEVLHHRPLHSRELFWAS